MAPQINGNSQDWVDQKLGALDGADRVFSAPGVLVPRMRRRRTEFRQRRRRLAAGYIFSLLLLGLVATAPLTKAFASRCLDACLGVVQSMRSDTSAGVLPLESYRGKVVLINFWATWCPPCVEEIPILVELQNRYRDQGLIVLGISMDEGPWDAVLEFSRKRHVEYPLRAGNDAISKQFGGVESLPATLLVNRDGKVLLRKDGLLDQQKIEAAIRIALAIDVGSGSIDQ